jgi:hypothetical protein
LTASQSITYGQAIINVSGQLAAPAAIPTGEQVSIVIGPASGQATVQSDGSFSAAIDTNALSASSTPYTISYSYSGDVNFQSASDSSTTLTVNKATPKLNWPNPADIVYGTPLSNTQLDAGASVAGNFAYTPAAGTLLRAGAGQTLLVSFTPTDTTDYKNTSTTAKINVNAATPTITWANPADIVYGMALSSVQLDAAGSVPGTFTYTPSAGTILHAGAGQTLSVNFTPTDRTDYAPVTATATISVTRATPALTVSAPRGTYDGTPFPAAVAIASGIPGLNNTPAASLEDTTPLLTYYEGAGTSGTSLGSTPPTSAGTYTVVARFPGSTDYAPTQSAPVVFAIDRGVAALAVAVSPSSAVYGQSITFVATVAGAGVPSGTVTFLDGATSLATAPLDGSGKVTLTTTGLAIGSHAITATYSGDADFFGSQWGSTTETVSQAATEIVLVPHPVLRKKKVVSLGLTAEVVPEPPGGGVPTGMVTFEFLMKHGKKSKVKMLGRAALHGAEATLTVKPKAVLKKPITIIYGGDSNYQASTLTPPKLTRAGLKSLARPTTLSR